MLTDFAQQPSRPQVPLADTPYDRWVNPAGECTALFHRKPYGYLLRFPGQADFEIDIRRKEIRAYPASADKRRETETLFHNSILPVVGNHLGALNLHGSAVRIGERAVAFMGVSRRGKTTLAGAFARAGHPFLTEDVLSLERAGESYCVTPSRPVLRLFQDSAAYLRKGTRGPAGQGSKDEVPASGDLPFADRSAPLARVFILGPGEAETVSLRRLSQSDALAQLMQHAFILDVEDRRRLHRHFDRIGELAATVECHALDYPRQYEYLSVVIDAIIENLDSGET